MSNYDEYVRGKYGNRESSGSSYSDYLMSKYSSSRSKVNTMQESMNNAEPITPQKSGFTSKIPSANTAYSSPNYSSRVSSTSTNSRKYFSPTPTAKSYTTGISLIQLSFSFQTKSN